MLFLLRPRQTWMPYALPRSREHQDRHNRQLQAAYSATRGAPTYAPGETSDAIVDLTELGALHAAGGLTDDEFALAKRKILDAEDEGA